MTVNKGVATLDLETFTHLISSELKCGNISLILSINIFFTNESGFFINLDLGEQAIRFYLDSIALVPASWPIRNQLAVAYLDAGQPQKALDVLEESLNITKGNNLSAEALFFRGIALRELGEIEESLQSLERSVEMGLAAHLEQQAAILKAF